METLSLDEVLKILYMYKVRVNGDKLIVAGGNKFPDYVRASIGLHKRNLMEIYEDENLMQSELDDLENQAEEAEKSLLDLGKASDLWERWAIISASRKANLPKPWATITEDYQRCSFCPNLGKPVNEDGVVCEYNCESPY